MGTSLPPDLNRFLEPVVDPLNPVVEPLEPVLPLEPVVEPLEPVEEPLEPDVPRLPVALLPVPLEPEITLLEPVGLSLGTSLSSSSSFLLLDPLMGPLMAELGPGKSSGTIGRPRTLDSLGGGVLGETLAGVGVGENGALVEADTEPVPKLVWNGSVCSILIVSLGRPEGRTLTLGPVGTSAS